MKRNKDIELEIQFRRALIFQITSRTFYWMYRTTERHDFNLSFMITRPMNGKLPIYQRFQGHFILDSKLIVMMSFQGIYKSLRIP